MNTNLIYCCAFKSKESLEFLKTFLFTIKLYSRIDTFDMVVITSTDFLEDIYTISQTIDIPLKTMVLECNTIDDIYLSRFRIFNYDSIEKYSKILYLDTDILVHGDITHILELEIEDKIYGVNEPNITIKSIYHGGTLFDFTKVDKETAGVNSGALLFKNTDTIKNIFTEILYNAYKLIPMTAIDQSILNYYCIMNNLFGPNILGDYIFLSNKENPISPSSTTKYIMNHLYGATHLNKTQRITYHLQHLLNIYPSIQPKELDTSDIVTFKRYIWGSGCINFDKQGVLITSWGRGRYECFNQYIYKATWGGINHVLIFNNDFTRYTSICNNNMLIGSGSLDTVHTDTIPESSLYTNMNTISVGDKYLVYFCVFHNTVYLDLLEFLLLSLRVFSGHHPNIEYMVFVSESIVENVHRLINKLQFPIHIKVFDFKTQHEAGCARLHIFEYEFINNYSKILYLDTDIIVQGDIMTVFDSLKEDKLYAKREYDINGSGHGGLFFDFTQFPRDTPSLNSGTLLFKNSSAIRAIFHDINIHIKNLKEKTSLLPMCMDQPFIAYHFIKNRMCDIETISNRVFLSGDVNLDPAPPPPLSNDTIFCHFIWPIGNPWHKMNRMKKHLKKILEEYSKGSVDSSEFLDKSYSWKDGTVTFKANGVLQVNDTNHTYSMIHKGAAVMQINGSPFIFKLHNAEKPSIYPLCIDIENLSYSLEKRLASFNVLLATVGRSSLQIMLYSLSAQLNPIDCVTIVFDNTSDVPTFDFSKFRCKVNIHCEPVKLGYWGHGIRNKYASLLEKRDFIMHADDDDIYPSDCFELLRKDCINPDTLYIGKAIHKNGHITRNQNCLNIIDCGTTSGIIPYELNKCGTWGLVVGGGGMFNKQLEQMARCIQYTSYITYIIRPDKATVLKHVLFLDKYE